MGWGSKQKRRVTGVSLARPQLPWASELGWVCPELLSGHLAGDGVL